MHRDGSDDRSMCAVSLACSSRRKRRGEVFAPAVSRRGRADRTAPALQRERHDVIEGLVVDQARGDTPSAQFFGASSTPRVPPLCRGRRRLSANCSRSRCPASPTARPRRARGSRGQVGHDEGAGLASQAVASMAPRIEHLRTSLRRAMSRSEADDGQRPRRGIHRRQPGGPAAVPAGVGRRRRRAVAEI